MQPTWSPDKEGGKAPLSASDGAQDRLALFYRHFLTTPTAIVLTDPQGSIIEANRSFLELYGYARSEVVGNNPRMLKSGRQSPAAYQEMWRGISDPAVGSWTGELINRKKNGEEVVVLLTVSSVLNVEGGVIGYVASATDVTRSKQLEWELRESHRQLQELAALKSDLMAITSHDLKSPVNSIISRAQIILESGDAVSPESLKRQMNGIIEAGERMMSFIDDLLNLEKIESGRMQLSLRRTRIDAVLRSCVEINQPTAERKGVGIAFVSDGPSWPVKADIVKMEQVFNNLISNAVRFSPEGSVIEAVYRDGGPGAKKIVEIRDRGAGIPEEEIGRIFDRYYQVKKKGALSKRAFGAGLGLAIVKSIVEMHGGRITVANRPGGGCLFAVELPRAAPGGSADDLAALILDPESAIFPSLEEPLRRKNVACYIAKTPEEADRIARYQQPDVLFFDHDQAGTAEALDFLGRLRAGASPLIVAVGGAEGGDPPLYEKMLSRPVVDLEVYEVLRDLQFRGPGSGEPA